MLSLILTAWYAASLSTWGDQRLRTEDGIEVWPLHAFLAALAKHTLWP